MPDNSEPEATSICPNCQALNPPNTLVCASCGISLAGFEAALPRFRQLQSEQAQAHNEAVTERISELAQAEADRGHWVFGRQVRILLAIAVVVGLLAVVGSGFLGNQVRLRKERLAKQYKTAQACLDSGRYQCARDELIALLREDAEYLGAQQSLAQARYRLAEQYANNGQWQAGINELKAQLRESPGDKIASWMIQDMYARWLADALRRGDWWTATRLRMRAKILQSRSDGE